MRRLIVNYSLLFITCILFLTTCPDPYAADGETGTITINLDGGARAVAWPPAEAGILGQLHHDIWILSGDEIKYTVSSSGGGTVRINTAPGVYSIEVEAWYSVLGGSMMLYAKGFNENVEVKRNERTHVTIAMQPVIIPHLVGSADDWDAVFAEICNESSEKDSYYIIVTDDIEVDPTDENSFTLGDRPGIWVYLLGNKAVPPVISLKGQGSLLRIGEDQRVYAVGVALTGLDPNNAPLVVVSGDGSVFDMYRASVTGNNNTGSTTPGGGVYVESGGRFFMVDESVVSGNTAETGGGVYFGGNISSYFGMQNNTKISGNTAANVGGGIYISSGELIMTDSASVSGNTSISASGGGGIYTSGSVIMEGDATVADNKTPNGGFSGVYVGNNGALIMRDNASVTGNTGTGASGVYVNKTGTFTMTDNASVSGNISNSSGTGGGAGIYITGNVIMEGNATVSGNIVIDSSDNPGPGGGVAISQGKFTMRGNASVSGNTAAVVAGGVIISGTTDDPGVFTMEGGTVSGNTVMDSEGRGGGVYVAGNSIFRISNGTVYGVNEGALSNTAAYGAALLKESTSDTAQYGTFTDPNDPDTWSGTGLNTTNATIRVVNGVLLP